MLEFVRNWIYKLPVPPAVQEAILEALRLATLAFVSTIVTVLIDKVQSFPNAELWTFLLTMVLRVLDKYKHEENKETFKAKDFNGGLVGF